jgi:hypothetical protein
MSDGRMKRSDLQEHKTEWSTVGGVVTTLAGGGTYAWWIAATPAHSGLAVWPAFVLSAVALSGAYLMLAPLVGLPPWRDLNVPTPVPLEEWLQERIDAAETLARQRQVRSDRSFFKAMARWHTENGWDLLMKIAPDLADDHRANPCEPEQVDPRLLNRKLDALHDIVRGIDGGV